MDYVKLKIYFPFMRYWDVLNILSKWDLQFVLK